MLNVLAIFAVSAVIFVFLLYALEFFDRKRRQREAEIFEQAFPDEAWEEKK